jgi:hypothetical protein
MPPDSLIAESAASFAAWPPTWRAQALSAPPLIAPARQFTYPLQIAGEEDALARGAFQLLVMPATAGTFLATCALGFTNPAMPTALFACPNPNELCAVAGGYAYIIETTNPERPTHLALKPVVELCVVPTHNLLLFIGFHSILAWGVNGLAWQSARLSWEGIRLEPTSAAVSGDHITGLGWNLQTDREVAFTLDLRTGTHTGGGFDPPQNLVKPRPSSDSL